MNEQTMRFRIGVFVLGAAVLLAILIILFGQTPTLFSRKYTYFVTFKEAPGVEQGTPVRKSGVRIGEVTDIDLDPDSGQVKIEIAVEKKYQLQKGDQAVLSRGLILGETAINFIPEGDRTPAPEDYTFEGKPLTDLRQALGKASDLVPAAQATLEEIRLAAEAFNKLAPEIQKFVPEVRQTNAEVRAAAERFRSAAERVEVLLETNDKRITLAIDRFVEVAGRVADVLSKENQDKLKATLDRIAKASESLESLVKNADALTVETRTAVKKVGERVDSVGANAEELIKESRTSIKRADEVLTNLQQATKPMAERSAVVMKNLEEMTTDIRSFTKALSEGDGTLRRLVADPTLYNSLNETAKSLNGTMARIDRIMRDIQVFSDKIARHPELLGISGAVSPSGGIK